MHQIVFYIIVGILILDYLLDQVLGYLNKTKRSSKLPKELKGIYDEDKYRKSQEYEKANYNFSVFTSSFSLILILKPKLIG